jgi:hypothetical protein
MRYCGEDSAGQVGTVALWHAYGRKTSDMAEPCFRELFTYSVRSVPVNTTGNYEPLIERASTDFCTSGN